MKQDFIYLDNAATTWPKPDAVGAAVEQALRIGANPGRSSHRMSLRAESLIEEARLVLAKFFNAPSPGHVIFTLNCTDSLNIALKGLLKPGDRVVTGPYEHNSVMRPLYGLQRAGVAVGVARGTPEHYLDLEHFNELCTPRVDVAVVAHASNVTGCVLPVVAIAEIVHARGGILVLDAAQTAGIVKIDMQNQGIDVLAAPGHKGLLGPMGVGVLVLGRNISIEPFREGGTGFQSEGAEQPADLPWHLEGGTPNFPGIAGLLAGVRFVQSVGEDFISRHKAKLAGAFLEGLKEIKGASVFSNSHELRTGVVSFLIDSLDVTLAAAMLDNIFGIGIRAGLHCAPAAHKTIGTFPAGTLRMSLGFFNNSNHVEELLSALRSLSAGVFLDAGGSKGARL